jgi:nicotinamide-nucleotide amidase
VRPIVTAEIIAVGSELLTPTRLDTNSLFVTRCLAEHGIAVRAKAVVGDSREDLRALFTAALTRVDLILLTGGLGPTDDDVTREVVADALGRVMREDAETAERLRARFARRGLQMPDINLRQAMVPEGAEIVPNPNGTAPGLWLEHGDCVVVLLPGPPRELKPMIEWLTRQRLAPRAGATRVLTRTLRIAGQTESHAEEVARPFFALWKDEGQDIEATTLASPGSIDFFLSVRSADPASGVLRLEGAIRQLAQAFGEDAYTEDERSMEQVLGTLLREQGYTVAAAESCTGGLLTSRLTDVPGSSAYVQLSIVAYSNDAKTALLGVPAEDIAAHGAVSEPVALAMARGIRARAGSTIGIGITGIAGPDGGTPTKPVGTVAIAVDGPWGAHVRTRLLLGGREHVKFWATQAALDDVRRLLLRERAGADAVSARSEA